jgi:hypothetical protein
MTKETKISNRVVAISALQQAKRQRDRIQQITTALVLTERFNQLAEAVCAEGYHMDDVLYAAIRCICSMEPDKTELLAEIGYLQSLLLGGFATWQGAASATARSRMPEP